MIFDEATSALDSQSEQMIRPAQADSEESHQLVIAHRLSTIVDAEQILVMDKGRIIERGRHLDLIAAGGAYAKMWERQQHGKMVEADIEET